MKIVSSFFLLPTCINYFKILGLTYWLDYKNEFELFSFLFCFQVTKSVVGQIKPKRKLFIILLLYAFVNTGQSINFSWPKCYTLFNSEHFGSSKFTHRPIFTPKYFFMQPPPKKSQLNSFNSGFVYWIQHFILWIQLDFFGKICI